MKRLNIVILKISETSQYSKVGTLLKVNFSISDEFTEPFTAHFAGNAWNADFVIKSPTGVVSKSCSEKFRKILRKTPSMELFFSEVADLINVAHKTLVVGFF